jgi:hypothetical protein
MKFGVVNNKRVWVEKMFMVYVNVTWSLSDE